MATPFLALNPITSTALSIGMGGFRSWQILTDIHQSYTERNWRSFAWHNAQLAFVVSSGALIIFFPAMGIIVISSVQLVPEIYQLGQHLYHGEYLESGKDLLGLGSSLLYIGAMVVGGPELLLLSLIAQVIKEVRTSYKEFSQGRILEGVVNMVLAAIRVQRAAPHAMLLHRNHFGKTVTRETWDKILDAVKEERKGDFQKKVDIGKILEKGYYSSYINRNDLSTRDLSNLIIKDFSFTECNFEDSNLEGSIIENNRFRSCWMQSASFIDTVVRNSIFSNSKLNDAVFFKSSLSDVLFSKVDLEKACFNESTLNSVRYEDSILSETNFLQTQAEKTLLKNCQLTNTLLCDMKKTANFQNCTENVFTKPVVALSWNFRNQGVMGSATERVLREKDVISLRFDYYPDVDVDLLHKETAALLSEIEKDRNIDLSRLDEILKRASIDGEIAKLQKTANTIREK